MRALIKLGGTLLETPESRNRLAREITAALAADPERQIVVVHGGGKQMTGFLAERGYESKFVNGLRVTTPEIIDAVVKVFAGSVNTALVTAFRAAGARPVGLTGLDASLVDAVQLNPELGQVGRPVKSDPRLLELLTSSGYIPVVACVGGDDEGNIYNVNADQMAVACAGAFGVDHLLFLTDVEGVRDGEGVTRTTLTTAQAAELIASGAATGGMQAKLEAATKALESGVKKVWIAPGAREDSIEVLLGADALTQENPVGFGTKLSLV